MRTVFSTIIALLFSCCANAQFQKLSNNNSNRIYSKCVGDSFSVFVHLPGESRSATKKFPVVYLLDGNFTFDIATATLDKYAMFAMTDSVILIGIGYKDPMEMDSLRDRDFTFPKALPEYGMSNSGGGERFLEFINHELIPLIDQQFQTDTNQRILIGHSLGGYFTLFALLRNAQKGIRPFSHYIAGSPSLHYNNYFLFRELKKQRGVKNTSVYFTFGTLEDNEEAGVLHILKAKDASAQLSALLKACGLRCKSEIFSNLAHMDTPIPTMIRGLQWSLSGP
jgi:predicted alpha/beta superfamily hydrolase